MKIHTNGVYDTCNTLLSNNLGFVIWLNMLINIQGPSLRNLFSELICIDQLQIFSNTELIKLQDDFADIVFCQIIKLSVFINLKPIFLILQTLFSVRP